MTRFRDIFRQLQRRKVIRSGIAYVVSVWFVVQIADVLLEAFDAPNWVMQALVIALAMGFPAVLLFSWFFEITAEGIKRTEDVPPDDSAGPLFDRRVDFVIISMLVAALAVSVYGNLRGPDAPRESVSVLIADFNNETDTSLFADVLEESLRVGLEVSPFIDAFSRKAAASIAEQLPGVRADPLSLDLETAGLVALRQGINILIGGTISRSGTGLTVSVAGYAPGSQEKLFTATETVTTDAEILNAIASISRTLRIALGDTRKPGGAGENESFAVANLEAASEYLIAQDLQLDRKLEEAAVHYRKSLAFDPDFARAHAGLALTEQYLGNMEAATEHWTETLSRLDRLTERGRLRTLGNYYMINQRDYDNALATYERLVERYPADNVAQNNLAVTAFYTMDFGRALEVGRIVADRFPKHSGYRANLALYAMYASNFDEASEVARKLINDDPSSAYAFLVRALTQAVAGDLPAAENTFRSMTGLDQFGRSIGIEGLADLEIYRGNNTGAIDLLESAIEEELAQNAHHTAALKQVMRAQVLLKSGKLEQAQSAIETALTHSGGDPAILVPASLMLIELGDIEQAESIAAEMSQSTSKPKRAYANAIRAQVAHTRGRPAIAVEHANSAIELADLWLVRFIRGKVYLQARRTDEAMADLEVCRQRIGEGIAVFLNDRPSFRLMRDLDAAIASAGTPRQTGSTELEP